MTLKPKIFSFFAGSGFLDLGFEASGYDVVYVSEIFKPFMAAYKYSRVNLNLPLPEYGYHDGEDGDVNRLISHANYLKSVVKDCRADDRNIIGFIGGPPCPDFAVGGKNRGCSGSNGKLSSSYVELICQQQPDFFVFENVKGLWKTQKHRLFYDALKALLQQAGYILTERLINAVEYGVPQDRQRIILIGFHSSYLNINEDRIKNFPWLNYILYSQDTVFAYPWSQSAPFVADSSFPCPEKIPQELTVEYWFNKNNVLSHPNSLHHFQPKAGLKKFASIAEGDNSRKSFKRLHRWRYSPTACYGNNEVHLHPYKLRRISVAEALAIQSLPSNFILPDSMSLTNMFKTIGNGVPFLASKAIAQSILDFIQGSV
ncbi:cytosine-specific DNA methyltransferase [Calothrix sp. NIES-4071]|nr:cytosine-specific DNA methyltransferase [Calothrix sp. NIES-4071]BAZ62442.1 cytosine-specific DNA methyltransferase [Calothrix sp. NIES-4105]